MQLPESYSGISASSRYSARVLCIDVPFATPNTDNQTVMALFTEHKDLIGLPVVEEGKPFGMINRHIFLSQMARPFFRELYDRKSCIAFMDKFPLVIEVETSLENVAQQVVENGDKSVADGFILTEQGRYVGIGLGVDLIRRVSDLQAQQHQQILQSIEYARVIQDAMLDRSNQLMARELRDWCLHWQPRDGVGGDYYAFHRHPHGWLAVIADCTGHGIPGAFMTVILQSALEYALREADIQAPATILNALNRHIKQTLGQLNASQQTSLSNDGCDAIVLSVNTELHQLRWASARTLAFMLGNVSDEIISLSQDRVGVGYTDTPEGYSWPEQVIPLSRGDMLFILTDGVTDQLGGERNIMFGKKRIQACLTRYQNLSMPALSLAFQQDYLSWQGHQARRDDVTWFGFRY
ncbi:SpoIIE family protein phosphatase [Pantoea sp. LMR881]|uniref:SpoIIE family protein phosphatase n=1 Tax=Pantoea sp. LMR881 TaxID=3014336 RepID=UPI0022B02ADC|nr:SpoIIE family protein phosphatase [Pantoea sp. LMR881]MCZ4060224.1 SpoIIE family protein phosphatase [Pantoea sp. LMR881]